VKLRFIKPGYLPNINDEQSFSGLAFSNGVWGLGGNHQKKQKAGDAPAFVECVMPFFSC
jgi:hypothetical protein